MYKSRILPEEIEKMPLIAFNGPIHVIDREGPELHAAVAYLRAQKSIGFDTETRPVFMPGEQSCGVALLQLSSREHAYLFRLNRMGLPRVLCELLSDPRVEKIGAASFDDVRGLRKLHDFEAHGFVDLQRIAWKWGINDKSVKKMAAIILGGKVSKTQQLSNWEAAKLNDAQLKYAATDAWVCLVMYDKLLKSPKNPHVVEDVQNYIKEG